MHIVLLVSSRPDCIFEIHLLWQSDFSRVYSNCCCICRFEPEIIKIGQSPHKMYSNNIVNFQESSTILNASTKKSGNLLNTPCKTIFCKLKWVSRDEFNKFPDLFVQVFEIVVDSWTFHYVVVVRLMRWLTNFYDFRIKSTATAAIGIHPTKVWLLQLVNFKNAIWTWGHFRRTTCNKIVLNLEKIPRKCMEWFRLLLEHLAWIEY